jgi:hypothetical protein
MLWQFMCRSERFSLLLNDSNYKQNFNCTVVNTQSFTYINFTFKNISGTNGIFIGKACSTHEKMLKNSKKTEGNYCLIYRGIGCGETLK